MLALLSGWSNVWSDYDKSMCAELGEQGRAGGDEWVFGVKVLQGYPSVESSHITVYMWLIFHSKKGSDRSVS
jgi:hypothetical protein